MISNQNKALAKHDVSAKALSVFSNTNSQLKQTAMKGKK
jgi:hypothetical protein